MKGLWSPLPASWIHDLKEIMLTRTASPASYVFFCHFQRNVGNAVSANVKVELTSLLSLSPSSIQNLFLRILKTFPGVLYKRQQPDGVWPTHLEKDGKCHRQALSKEPLTRWGPIDTSEGSVFSVQALTCQKPTSNFPGESG